METNEQISLVFFDIDTYSDQIGNNPIEFLLRNKNINIIFLIKSDNLLSAAFESTGVNYLSKPIRKYNLDIAMKKIHKQLLPNPINLKNNSIPLKLKKIIASKEKCKFLLSTSKILYFYYQDNEVKVVTDNEYIYSISYSLQSLEIMLAGENFFRCHKGFLVNVEKVTEIIPSNNSTKFEKPR